MPLSITVRGTLVLLVSSAVGICMGSCKVDSNSRALMSDATRALDFQLILERIDAGDIDEARKMASRSQGLAVLDVARSTHRLNVDSTERKWASKVLFRIASYQDSLPEDDQRRSREPEVVAVLKATLNDGDVE